MTQIAQTALVATACGSRMMIIAPAPPTNRCLRSSRTRRFVLSVLIVFGMARPAHADLTAFLGLSPTPDNRGARGFAGGFSMVIIGFEFEYSQILEDEIEALPSLKTWSGNVLLQTPVELHGVQLYATAGGGGYRERLGDDTVTHVDVNLGGGAKIRVAGPAPRAPRLPRLQAERRTALLAVSPLLRRREPGLLDRLSAVSFGKVPRSAVAIRR